VNTALQIPTLVIVAGLALVAVIFIAYLLRPKAPPATPLDAITAIAQAL
jgi:hypothetical protein